MDMRLGILLPSLYGRNGDMLLPLFSQIPLTVCTSQKTWRTKDLQVQRNLSDFMSWDGPLGSSPNSLSSLVLTLHWLDTPIGSGVRLSQLPCPGSHSTEMAPVDLSLFYAVEFFSDMTLVLSVHIVISQSKCSLETKDIKLVKKPMSDSLPDLTVLCALLCTLWVLNKY